MKSWYDLKASADDITYYYNEDFAESLGIGYNELIRTQRWKDYSELYDTVVIRDKICFLQKQSKSNIKFEKGRYRIYPAIVRAQFVRKGIVLK